MRPIRNSSRSDARCTTRDDGECRKTSRIAGPSCSSGSGKSSHVLRTKIPVVCTVSASDSLRSISRTRKPRRASSREVCSPARPAPITATSNVITKYFIAQSMPRRGSMAVNLNAATPMSARTAPRTESSVRKWGTLMVLSLALAIIIIDSTLLNVSLSTLIRELNTNLQSLQWVISAYSLMLAALTVTGGRMGDLFGRKKMFMGGAVIFAVGSFIASISRSVPVLLLGESIIEGIGAALMMPATASLLISKYRGHDRAIAFGIWGGVAAAASAIGPILGGFLTTHYSWRWGFRINLFVVALLLLGSVIVEDTQKPEGKKIDWVGVLLSAAGLFFVVFGIIESESYGWIRPRKPFPIWQAGSISIAPLALLLGVIILVFFGMWERRLEGLGGTPIVSMRLFQNQQFVAGASVVGVLMLAQNGVIFSLPVFLQSVKQLDALHTGLTLLPMSLALL